MATLYIAEYKTLQTYYTTATAQVPLAPPVTEQTVAIGVGSTQSNAFNANTSIIRVHTDAICSIKVGGTNPTATSTTSRMAAGQTEYYGVAAGDKIAVITNT